MNRHSEAQVTDEVDDDLVAKSPRTMNANEEDRSTNNEGQKG